MATAVNQAGPVPEMGLGTLGRWESAADWWRRPGTWMELGSRVSQSLLQPQHRPWLPGVQEDGDWSSVQ